ncbi:CBS domain-containing protein [Catenovulum sp. SM1970]|uniref:CBS domain-containing protein n=1 Tax=Marinifaba aquimaris TaxID=2741323 RepID=UPI0015718DD9|nr:CBS domain-containing protein [Marinifaba aquimaris]NTS77361.1 CBS domain-containing protein [Marinifaba aquimaris]
MESLKVEDYMKARPVKFHKDMSVAEAVELLISSNQSGGPVVDKQNKLVGFVSEQDCIQKMLESTYYREAIAKLGQFMVADVRTVKPYDSVLELAQDMAKNRTRIFPVVDDDGYLEGLITRHDIMVAIDNHLHDAYHMAS